MSMFSKMLIKFIQSSFFMCHETTGQLLSLFILYKTIYVTFHVHSRVEHYYFLSENVHRHFQGVGFSGSLG